MQPGTLVAGKYRVERMIGRGGMGFVVEATHLQLGSRVALKFLTENMASDPTALARFRREAQASAQLRSEHICRVSDVGVEGKTPFIVMELLVGTDLARLSKVRVLDVATSALYIRQACAGLAEAHAANIIHRDLKPGNLFLTRRVDGTPLIKILDFGVAKAPDENAAKLTGTSNVVGSPGFMSPEQFRSSKSVDGKADVWSLGVILYKLVSGRLPFKADGFAEFALAISRDPVPPLPEAPPPFAAVIARCLEKDPTKRYPDVITLGAALAPFAANAPQFSDPQIKLPPIEPDPLPVAPAVPAAAPRATPVPVSVPFAKAVVDPKKTQIAGSDSGGHVLVAAQAPIASPTALGRAVTPPVGVPAAAKQTILGMTSAPTLGGASKASEPGRPTALETSQGTLPGAAVTGVKRYTPLGDLTPGMTVGEYRIDARIGEGGMGAVYSATHPMIGKRAAIKVISAELGMDPVVVQRFVQEARSVNQIGHPNIVDVFAFGQLADGRNYFVMEYLQGESLRDRLKRSFLTISEAVQILDEIAGALEAAHDKQIVHRDLKPDNVYLASVRGGLLMVKLLDFGIAKLVGEAGIAKTSTGEMMGTPAYLSPEQARGKNVDHRTDIYALGCMLYEMITGRFVFMAESAADMIVAHISETPLKPSAYKPDLPPLLDQTIMAMLEKDPERRPSLMHLRNVFAELVASGMIAIESGSTGMFRSELGRRRGESEIRTPRSGQSHKILRPPGEPDSVEVPTTIKFTPGLDTLVPSDNQVTGFHAASLPRSRMRGVVIALLILVVGAGAGVAAISMLKSKDTATGTAAARAPAGSAAGSGSGPPAAVPPSAAGAPPTAAGAPPTAGSVSAGTGATTTAGSDETTATATAAGSNVAAEVVKRSVEIRSTVPSATIEIDGNRVAATKGVAKAELVDGEHLVTAKAAGYEPATKTVAVGADATAFVITLGRTRRASHPTSSTGKGSAAAKGSASPTRPDKDATLDPFAN